MGKKWCLKFPKSRLWVDFVEIFNVANFSTFENLL